MIALKCFQCNQLSLMPLFCSFKRWWSRIYIHSTITAVQCKTAALETLQRSQKSFRSRDPGNRNKDIQENHSRYLGSSLAREITSNLNDLNAKTEDFAIKCNLIKFISEQSTKSGILFL
jgi:hypothetical protein